ncbi:MAG: DNA mismatch repair protein MutS [Bacteroidales bacterium]|nr:DNA mismatch repair protein MutS [Bacteroidales bacterium]
MKEKNTAATPMLKQYFEIKAQYPEAILLYRVGDFYETYGEDALKASRVLGIVLTRKSAGNGQFIEMAGIPHHAIDNYLPRLVQNGYKVAVCDQLEDPKLTKKLVKRGVTELITPGVAYNDNLLKAGENNWLAAFSFSGKEVGMAFLDISTGAFKLAQGTLDYAEVLLSTLAPHEILVERSFLDGFRQRFSTRACITPLDPWTFVPDAAYRKVCAQMETGSLKGFGVENLPQGIAAAGAILFYLEMTQHHALGHIKSLSRIDESEFVWMDRFTFRNLEVFQSLAGTEGRSLIEAIGRCCTPMGNRQLREWLSMPIKDIARLNARYDTVDAFLADETMRTAVRDELSNIGDLERIVAKAAAGRLLPREALQLARALRSSAAIQATLAKPELAHWCEALDDCSALAEKIGRTLLPEAAAALGKGDVIAAGVSPELDKLRDTLHGGRQILLDIQQREREATGISSLKISYNNVFGYYLEVRNTFKDKVPADWIRKQTLVGAERYITPELKQYEETILGAEQHILDLETRLYGELVEAIRQEIPAIQHNAATLAQLDVLAGFAVLAYDHAYCRPVLNDSLSIDIKQGRHPVIEQLMPEGEQYVANDLHLDSTSQQIMILTGPNMAGKSAFLRQTALICLLAQTGCFVPAKGLKMGIVDKIFTRVGASDNISRGESTFMVEMLETATILNNLSDRSLILLDEIGRGTSTFDGMSIAWSIVEYIHSRSRAKTLFATHYHELNELENRCPRVHNFHISVKEMDGQVIFLRKLCPGGVAHSFGIHVARLAGMPSDVVYRAEKKLRELEAAAPDMSGERPAAAQPAVQLSLYQLDDPLLLDIKDELARMDINKMSPLDAFDALRGLKKKIGL